MDTVIVTVVVTLGIIIAGGFLIYFLGDLFMSIASRGKKDDEAIKGKTKRDSKKIQAVLEEKYPEDADKIKNDPEYAEVVLAGGQVEAYDPNEEERKAEEEQEVAVDEAVETQEEPEAQEEPAQTEEPAEEPAEEAVEEPAEEPAQAEDDNAEAERIARRRQEILDRINRLTQEAEEEEEAEEESEEEVDLTEEGDEEAAEEAEETEEAPAEEPADVDDAVVGFTAEELEELLAKEKEELKANEKELRKCKKEFIPLRRVKKTLERDEQKLRRREALVAKQKVELYGVNNIADIDEEKAKKLSEDLDLLDGLKLSVQHCEEVMEKNADRYPLLKKMYEVLKRQNTELKDEIKSLREQIAEIEAEQENPSEGEEE